jgi:glycosyltransferase involved in cell wall biosynthesis
VLNNENVEHVILRRYLDRERNPAKVAYAWLEHRKMKRWEREVCARSTVAMACSAIDQDVLQALCPTLPITIVPNVVDLDPFDTDVREDPLTILFQGGMDWYPNRDAVQFFTRKILPEIRRRVPGARFVVAGRNPAPAFVSTFADVQGMTFTGTVNDIRPFIAKAAVCVAPLRIGSGTRLKILEAAAMAKSVVSTRIGAEGLLLVPGEDIILADDADSFATSVAALLGDAPRRCAMGRSARARLERHYSRGALLGAIRQALTHIPPCPAKALRSIRGMPDRFTVRG